MDTNEWRRQRERILGQIQDLETGRVEHFNEDRTNKESLGRLQQRLKALDTAFAEQSRDKS